MEFVCLFIWMDTELQVPRLNHLYSRTRFVGMEELVFPNPKLERDHIRTVEYQSPPCLLQTPIEKFETGYQWSSHSKVQSNNTTMVHNPC